MPITLDDFTAEPIPKAPTQSGAFDADRPFMFEGLVPQFSTRVIRSCFIPMRDGIRLSTNFHIPLGATLPLPVVLLRTPYNKNFPATAMPTLLPEQGIIFAIQDVRGRHESEGEFIACHGNDRDDGEDTLDWLVAQPWCSGAIGTMGSSYSGETAAKIAATCHPAHRCSVIMFDGSYAGANSQNGAYLQGGATMLRMMFGWFRDHVPKISFGPPPHIDRQQWFSSPFADTYSTQPVRQPPVDVDRHLLTLPVFDLLDRSGAAPSEFTEMMRRSADPGDPYWAAQQFLCDDDRFSTPTIFMTGPLERGGSSFDNFRLFKANATNDVSREHQYLWFTPAAHSGYAACREGDRSGARALGDTRYPYYQRLIAWFGHWLRGDPLDLSKTPKVEYYVLNDNRWRHAENWPPAEADILKLYLRAGDSKASELGGRLTPDLPKAGETAATYTYDPADPTPSEPPDAALDALGGGYAVRNAIEARDDVLTYTTSPLERPLVLAGPVQVSLHVSTSAPDTDFVAVLSEIDANGQSINIIHGLTRARFREGLSRQVMMSPGEVYPITIDLWHVSIAIPAGHRVRLSISSSYFPAFDRNLNTGGNNFADTHWAVATNRVHHCAAYPSALLLPVCK